LLIFLLGDVQPGGGMGELKPGGLHIGLSGTLMRDVPEVLIRASARPLQELIESQTNLKTEFTVVPDPDKLAERLAAGEATLGVFPGCEFAWVRQQYPDLCPLVVAVNGSPHVHALVLVRNAATAKSFGDLQTLTIALPRGNRQHCLLFFERSCRAAGGDPDKFFNRVERPASAEEAIDGLIDGQVDAVLIDGATLEGYLRRKPGRGSQVRELVRSETFPAAVVAYQAGAVDETCLRNCRDGLLSAKQTAVGRQALVLWRMTGFEPVPKDYEQTLATIAKAYPKPAPKRK
jgi:ABC-type phosphate/phosphonate transport system substrate-binding protein